MGVEEADLMEEVLKKAQQSPVWSADGVGGVNTGMYMQAGMYGKSLRDIATWVAFRESDREYLKSEADWKASRQYRLDNLPERISSSFSDLLYGEDPEIKPAEDDDADALAALVEANDLPSELRRMVNTSSSEGEVWWRIYVNDSIADVPILESGSRLDCIPLWFGRKLAAVAFIQNLGTSQVLLEHETQTVYWRYVQIQTEGYVRNLLYKGGIGTLGNQEDLSQQEATKDIDEEWKHDLPIMLAGRIPNKIGRDYRLGISDYQGIKDILFDLNEARTIAAENARLTAKKRMVIPANQLDEDGNWDAGEDLIVQETITEDLEDKNGPYTVLEYQFDARALYQHINELASTALTRVGLAEQFTGSSSHGGQGNAGATGTSLRTRFIPTTLAATGKARYYDDGAPKMLQAMQMVDELSKEKGGCGHTWKDSKSKPAIERTAVLPQDPNEEVTRHVAAVAGEIESVEQAVTELRKGWDDEQIQDELKKIKEDRTTYGINPPPVPPGGKTPGQGPDQVPPDGTPAPDPVEAKGGGDGLPAPD